MILLVDENDLGAVKKAVAGLAAEWHDFGLALGICNSDLESIQSSGNPTARVCLRKMLTQWLKQNYDVSTPPVYSASLQNVHLLCDQKDLLTNIEHLRN